MDRRRRSVGDESSGRGERRLLRRGLGKGYRGAWEVEWVLK